MRSMEPGNSVIEIPQRKPASSPQLWRLNTLGLLPAVLDPDGHAYADRAHCLLAAAADDGRWQGAPTLREPDPVA